MFIGVLTVKLHIPWAHSLKDKRQVIKSLCAKARQHYNVAAAEVVCVAAAMAPCQTQLDALERFVEDSTDAVIVEMTRELR